MSDSENACKKRKLNDGGPTVSNGNISSGRDVWQGNIVETSIDNFNIKINTFNSRFLKSKEFEAQCTGRHGAIFIPPNENNLYGMLVKLLNSVTDNYPWGGTKVTEIDINGDQFHTSVFRITNGNWWIIVIELDKNNMSTICHAIRTWLPMFVVQLTLGTGNDSPKVPKGICITELSQEVATLGVEQVLTAWTNEAKNDCNQHTHIRYTEERLISESFKSFIALKNSLNFEYFPILSNGNLETLCLTRFLFWHETVYMLCSDLDYVRIVTFTLKFSQSIEDVAKQADEVWKILSITDREVQNIAALNGSTLLIFRTTLEYYWKLKFFFDTLKQECSNLKLSLESIALIGDGIDNETTVSALKETLSKSKSSGDDKKIEEEQIYLIINTITDKPRIFASHNMALQKDNTGTHEILDNIKLNELMDGMDLHDQSSIAEDIQMTSNYLNHITNSYLHTPSTTTFSSTNSVNVQPSQTLKTTFTQSYVSSLCLTVFSPSTNEGLEEMLEMTPKTEFEVHYAGKPWQGEVKVVDSKTYKQATHPTKLIKNKQNNTYHFSTKSHGSARNNKPYRLQLITNEGVFISKPIKLFTSDDQVTATDYNPKHLLVYEGSTIWLNGHFPDKYNGSYQLRLDLDIGESKILPLKRASQDLVICTVPAREINLASQATLVLQWTCSGSMKGVPLQQPISFVYFNNADGVADDVQALQHQIVAEPTENPLIYQPVYYHQNNTNAPITNVLPINIDSDTSELLAQFDANKLNYNFSWSPWEGMDISF